MSTYRLHFFPESGNSYKLALMLTLCGTTFEPVWTDFASGVTWTPEWRRDVNTVGEIPVLEEDGRRLTQTGPILLHLAERFGRFGGRDEAERFETLRWLFWDNQKLSGFMASYRFLRTFTKDADPAILKWQRRRVDDFLSILETGWRIAPLSSAMSPRLPICHFAPTCRSRLTRPATTSRPATQARLLGLRASRYFPAGDNRMTFSPGSVFRASINARRSPLPKADDPSPLMLAPAHQKHSQG